MYRRGLFALSENIGFVVKPAFPSQPFYRPAEPLNAFNSLFPNFSISKGKIDTCFAEFL